MKISELPLTTSVTGSEILPIVQGGTTKKVSIADALAGAVGVSQLNGLTGNLSLISTDNSVTITPLGSTIDLSAGGGGYANLFESFAGGNNLLYTSGSSNNDGFYFDFISRSYVFGQTAGGLSLSFDVNSNIIALSDSNNNNINFYLFSNLNQIFLGNYSVGSGLKLDFASDVYRFGDTANNDGVVLASSSYLFGQSTTNKGVFLDWSNNYSFFGNYQNHRGYRIDYANEVINFGDCGNFDIYVDLIDRFIGIGDWDYNNNQTKIYLNDTAQVININSKNANITSDLFYVYSGNVQIHSDSINKTIKIGDIDGSNNSTIFYLNDNFSTIEFNTQNYTQFYAGTSAGLYLNDVRSLIGDFDIRNNGSYFGVNDNIEKLVASRNLITTSSGSSSGQHLKINIDGNNFVIELKNP